MLRVAHLSDLHIRGDSPIPIHHLFNKRITGYANLLTARKNAHPRSILDALLSDVEDQQVDHVCITGDLTNLSHPTEFQTASQAIRKLGGQTNVSVVPGNHDTYTIGAARSRRFETYFKEWLSPETGQLPFTKPLRSGLRITGVSSAIPTPPFLSYGKLKGAQLEWLQQLEPQGEQDFQVVLMHHNLHRLASPFKNWSKRLRNASSTLQLLMEKRVDMVLHGHTHVHQRTKLNANGHSLFLLGCGSSTWNHPDHKGRYSIYTIEDGSLQNIESRVYNPATEYFERDTQDIELVENPAWAVHSGIVS